MEIDGDSKLGRIFEQFALSLNQHSKLTAISVDFIYRGGAGAGIAQ